MSKQHITAQKNLQPFYLQALRYFGMKISGEGDYRTCLIIHLIFNSLWACQKLTHRITHQFFLAFLRVANLI
jgi:hypothetical protein